MCGKKLYTFVDPQLEKSAGDKITHARPLGSMGPLGSPGSSMGPWGRGPNLGTRPACRGPHGAPLAP